MKELILIIALGMYIVQIVLVIRWLNVGIYKRRVEFVFDLIPFVWIITLIYLFVVKPFKKLN